MDSYIIVCIYWSKDNCVKSVLSTFVWDLDVKLRLLAFSEGAKHLSQLPSTNVNIFRHTFVITSS